MKNLIFNFNNYVDYQGDKIFFDKITNPHTAHITNFIMYARDQDLILLFYKDCKLLLFS